MIANRAIYPIATMCRLLCVSASGYYAWQGRRPSARAAGDAALLGHIRVAHEQSYGTYGAPRIHAELAAKGIHVGRKRTARLMRASGLAGVSRRKGPRTTRRREGARPAPDLVDRTFTAERPDQLWVADITYVPTWAGFLYLAVVLDVFSRRVIGWAMATHLRTQLVLDALEMALGQRRPSDVIHHSDQGSQYTSIAFGARCRQAGVGPPWDRSATAMIMRCARASSPPLNANSSTRTASGLRPRRAWPSSSSSKDGTIPAGGTRPSATCRPSTTKGATYPPLTQIRNPPRNRGNSTLHSRDTP